MKLSSLLAILILLLILTTRSWAEWRSVLRGSNRTLGQIYQDTRSGKQAGMSPYAKIVTVVAMALAAVQIYLTFSGR
jgi:hypothetical protein